MNMRKHIPLVFFTLLIFGSAAAVVVYFSERVNVEVVGDSMEVSPMTFGVSVAKGGHYVKEITVSNSGDEKQIYFDEVVEGPDSKAVDVTFHRTDGTSISSTNRLTVPAGSSESPSKVKVNVHIDVDDDAPEGEYTVYLMARS